MVDNLYFGINCIILGLIIILSALIITDINYVVDIADRTERIERILTEEGYYEAWSAWKVYEEAVE